METGGGGRSQGEGVTDNVKYNREDGGAEGRRVMRANQRPQVLVSYMSRVTPKPSFKSQPRS